jgi:beta-lactamase class C
MKTNKYFIILAVFIVIAIALKFQSLTGNPKADKDISEEILEVDHSKEIKEVLSKFDSLYNISIEQSGAVGGAVVITYKGQIVKMKCFGVKKAGENNPVDKNTIFRLASVSKTITGVLAGILASEGTINLDDKVVDYLPGFKLKLPESTNSVTIRNLLSHTSGLIAHAFDIMVEDQVPLNQIMQRLNEVEIVAPPGLVYAYQNVMFSLFDPIIATKTKKSFQNILSENVFIPFGMTNASADFESFERNENKAFPHQKTEKGYSAVRLNDRYYSTAPAAGINASISDMGQFLIAVSTKDDNLLSEKARKIIFTPQVETPLRRTYYRNWDNIDSKQYAIGWRIVNYKDHIVANHGGYVSGYQSEIAICEEEELGIVILTNSPNSYFSEGVPTFLNLFFDFKNKLKLENNTSEKNQVSNP